MKLRYVELDINQIFNRSAPEHQTAWYWLPKHYRDRWWDNDVVEIRNYFAQVWTEEFDKITNHFSLLEKSISEQGILHPVSIVCGIEGTKYLPMFPPDYHIRQKECCYTYPFGGSRVSIASKLNITTIPCVVHDQHDMFLDAEEINQDNYTKWFDKEYVFNTNPPHLRIKQHLHLTDSTYKTYSGTTRTAQSTAATIAQQKIKEKYG